MNNYWHKQTVNQPLYPDLIWSRPENKQLAGKLLIIGGSSNGFSATVSTYDNVIKAGVGIAKVLLPDSIKKTVGRIFEDVSFAPSTSSGGLGQQALADMIEQTDWCDGVIIPGELGHNSETTILIEKFLREYSGIITLTNDSAGYATSLNKQVLGREKTLLVTEFAQLQKISTKDNFLQPFTSNISLVQFVDNLHEFTIKHKVAIITQHDGYYITSFDGQVSTMPIIKEDKNWQTIIASHASVWLAQNPSKIFETINCGLITSQEKHTV